MTQLVCLEDYERAKWFTTLQLGFWVVMTFCNSTYFNECECYHTSCMSCNKCNSPYMKPYKYTTCATQLQLCKNNYYAILM
jgi:hypothetical protein